jgi:CheY-like chemotaxis protein
MSRPSRVILLLEERTKDVESFERALRACQFDNPVHAVHTAEEAISYLRGEGRYANRSTHPLPHLIVLDANMQGKNGRDVLRWIQERPELNRFVIIMLDGDGSESGPRAAQRLGVHAHHTKPATQAELETLVKRIGEFWLLGGEV